MNKMRKSIMAANKEADQWLTAEDFVRWLDNNRPNRVMPRMAFAAFVSDDWVAFYASDVERRDTAVRQFERWKRSWGYPSGFLTRWADLSEVDTERLDSALFRVASRRVRNFYLVPLAPIQGRVAQAIRRRDELIEAARAMRGEVGRRKHYVRSATAKEVGQALGVAPQRILEWSRRLGLPFRKKGKRGKLFSVDEVEDWTAAREAAGIRVATSEDVRNRVPAEEARPRFREIRAYLGLTNDRMAELLGISPALVSKYVGERWAGGESVKSIPASVMKKAEALLDSQIARTTRTTKTQRVTADQVHAAMKESRGSIKGAAALLGISREGLIGVARDLSIELRPRRVSITMARPVLLKVRSQLKLANHYFAELLGVSAPTLHSWLGLGGKWRTIKTVPAAAVEKAESLLRTMKPRIFTKTHLQRITAAQVQSAWDQHRNVKGAAKELGVSPCVLRPMAEHRGVDIPEALIGMITKRQLEDLLERHQGVRARMAEELGVTPPYVTMLLKAAGLYTAAQPSASKRGRIGKEEVEQILRGAIRDGLPPHAAAKRAGISRASILKRAAKRSGLLSLYEEADKARGRANPPRSFLVRSPAQGLRAIEHPVITKNYERALRVKPKHKKAVLVPCAGTKPFPDSPSHKHGYLKGLEGKKLDVYVVSEPLGIVPYEWSRRYPQESYDFPPRHLRGPGRELLVDRIATWFERGPRYEKIYLALPGHHRRLVLHALEQFDYPPAKIKDVGLGACLESGSCPPGNVRPTTRAYRHFLKARANPIPALFAGDEPLEVLGPTYPGSLTYWDARFEDGEEGSVPAYSIYSRAGDRWAEPPPRPPGRPAWTNNPRNPGDWKVPPKCDPEGTGRKLDAGAYKGKRVRLHVNLHNGCYVVSHKGKVAGYAKAVTIKDVVPKIGVGGWNRCNSTKVRNVHAWLEGTFVSARAAVPRGGGWRKISYNCKAHPRPEFFYTAGRKKTFEGAAEVRLVRKKGVGMAQIEVWAKGRAKKANPGCCGLPGGACVCGAAEGWWRENPNEIAPCGSAPSQVGVHAVVRPGALAVMLLDVGNVRAYSARDWHERGRCPLLAGFSVVRGEPRARVARDMLHAELAHHEHDAAIQGDLRYLSQSEELAQLARRVGAPLAEVEDALWREGLAWSDHVASQRPCGHGVASNP